LLVRHNSAEQGTAEDPAEVDHPEKLTNRGDQGDPVPDAVTTSTPQR
jgi:hypothetical protein